MLLLWLLFVVFLIFCDMLLVTVLDLEILITFYVRCSNVKCIVIMGIFLFLCMCPMCLSGYAFLHCCTYFRVTLGEWLGLLSSCAPWGNFQAYAWLVLLWCHTRTETRNIVVLAAPDSFATAMDWLLERSVGRGMNGVSLGEQSFTDLDFADDVSLLAELLELLVPVLEVFQEEAAPLGLEVNWQKTTVQALSLIHIWRCRRIERCRSRWSPYH